MPDPTGKTIYGVSKTTIQGVLSLLVVILGTISVYQLPATVNPNVTHVWFYVTSGATLVTTVLKAVVAFMQGDAATS